MKIAVCDDEKLYRDQLTKYLNIYYKSLDILIEAFSSGEELLEKFNANHNAYELVFMDIEMKKADGISTSRQIREYNQNVIIIFLTSHAEYAPEGYEVDAFRFLLKPVNENKLIHALKDVHDEMDRNKKLLIKDLDREVLLRCRDIVYLEAQNVNVTIRTVESVFTIRKTLMNMEKDLQGPVFYKPHRSYLINLEYVTDYSNKSITMETGENIPLSRNKSGEFKEALLMYVKTCGR